MSRRQGWDWNQVVQTQSLGPFGAGYTVGFSLLQLKKNYQINMLILFIKSDTIRLMMKNGDLQPHPFLTSNPCPKPFLLFLLVVTFIKR